MKVLYFFQGSESLFNPFAPSAPFLYLLKTSENLTGDRGKVHWERMDEKNKTMISFRLLVCTDLLRIYRDRKVYINWWCKVLRNFSLVSEFFFEWIRCASEKVQRCGIIRKLTLPTPVFPSCALMLSVGIERD